MWCRVLLTVSVLVRADDTADGSGVGNLRTNQGTFAVDDQQRFTADRAGQFDHSQGAQGKESGAAKAVSAGILHGASAFDEILARATDISQVTTLQAADDCNQTFDRYRLTFGNGASEADFLVTKQVFNDVFSLSPVMKPLTADVNITYWVNCTATRYGIPNTPGAGLTKPQFCEKWEQRDKIMLCYLEDVGVKYCGPNDLQTQSDAECFNTYLSPDNPANFRDCWISYFTDAYAIKAAEDVAGATKKDLFIMRKKIQRLKHAMDWCLGDTDMLCSPTRTRYP